ncbi:MAG: helix-turn-helix transcriptional regulator [Bacteroidota bacterium]
MSEIPSIQLTSLQEKSFGFRIAYNREILLNEDLDHNPFRPHRIRFHAILFVLEGEGYHYIDFKKYKYQAGSIIFISKEQVHAFERNMERNAFFLLFREEFLARDAATSNLLQQLSLYNYHLYPPVINLNPQQLELFTILADRMKKEFDAPDDLLTEELIHSALKIFLCLAERIRKETRQFAPRSKYHEEYLKFQKLLKKHILKSRKVQFYADQLIVSPKTLNRITQEMLGQSAKNYIHELAIIEMKRLLMNTSYTIKEIAYESGFEETTNFVKYFKKHTAMNPSEFRKQF